MEDLKNSVVDFRKEYAKLDSLATKYGRSKELFEFQAHFAYIDSIAESLTILTKNPSKNVVAIVSLTRMLAESMGVLRKLMEVDTSSCAGKKFVKAYKKGKKYPIGLRTLTSELSGNAKDIKTLKKLYDECSKSTHFSKQSLGIISRQDDYEKAIAWCVLLFESEAASLRKSYSEVMQRLSPKARSVVRQEFL